MEENESKQKKSFGERVIEKRNEMLVGVQPKVFDFQFKLEEMKQKLKFWKKR